MVDGKTKMNMDIQNIMTTTCKRNKRFIDRVDQKKLLPISVIRNLFQDYDHSKPIRYQQSIVWHDVGCLFFLLYIKKKYPSLCSVPVTDEEMKVYPKQNLLDWISLIDYEMYNEQNPKYLIYYTNEKMFFDTKMIRNQSQHLQVHFVSHTFEKGSGHLGCLFIKRNQAFYYDSNGLKDPDEAEYYDRFERSLSEHLQPLGITYIPHRWEKGIQAIQNGEEEKYKMNVIGMCCAWSFLIVELKLMNPHLTIEEIESKIKRKYKNRLTRMIFTYQQEIHSDLLGIANEYFSK